MNIAKFSSFKEPLVLIYGIRSPIIQGLVNLLLVQKSRILLTDTLSSKTKQMLKKLPIDNEHIMFIQYSSLYARLHQLKKVNYLIYNLLPTITGSKYPTLEASTPTLSNREYLQEAKNLEDLIKVAVEFNANFTLLLPAYLHQFIEPIEELNTQLYEHSMYLFDSYFNKTRLNGRVIKLAEIIGKETDLSVATLTTFILKEIVKKQKITIPGDALISLSLISYPTASEGVLDLILNPKTKGKKIKLEDQASYSVLGFAHMVSDILEKGVKFETDPEDKRYIKISSSRDKLLLLESGIEASKFITTPQYPLDKALHDLLSILVPQKQRIKKAEPKKQQTKDDVVLVNLQKPKKKQPLQSVMGILTKIFSEKPKERHLQYKGLKISSFLWFVINFLLVLTFAFFTAPLIYFFARFMLLKQLIKDTLKTFEINAAQIDRLQAVYKDIDITIPTKIKRLKIPFVDDIEDTLTTADATIKLMKWHINLLEPVKEYIQTQDPQKIRYLIETAQKNPTELAETYVQLQGLIEELPPQYKAYQTAETILQLNKIFYILPHLLGYNQPVTWVITLNSGVEKPVVLLRFVVDEATFVKTKNEQTPQEFIENPKASETLIQFHLNPKYLVKVAQILNVPIEENLYQSAVALYKAYTKAGKETKFRILIETLKAIETGDIQITTGNQYINEFFACTPTCRD